MQIIQKRLSIFLFIRPSRTLFVHSIFSNSLVVSNIIA